MKSYDVKGMTCSACVGRVEKAVLSIDGVESCTVSLLTNSMSVEGKVDDEKVIKAVEKAGYVASVKGADNKNFLQKEEKETKKLKKRLFLSLIFLLVLMYLSMGHGMLNLPLPEFLSSPLSNGITQLCLCVIILVINKKFFINGYKSLFKLAPNMDSLVALSSSAAFIYSVINLILLSNAVTSGNNEVVNALFHDLYFETSAMIVTLITIGKTLESYSKGKTTSALKELISLTPKTAIKLENGEEKTVSVEELNVGDLFVVYPGGAIPVDGDVIEGASAIDESALTGEGIPVDKECGDSVSAGTINLSGYIKCVATSVGADTKLSKIIQIVENTAATKAPIAKLADKVSGIFVPVVMAISVITLLVWLIVGEGVGFSLSRAISVLVISCPCALGLATPVAIVVGSGKGAKKNILFKTAEALELCGQIDVVALDKTGTITEGKPVVTDVIPVSGEREELLAVAFSLEKKSEHPLSQAVVEYAKTKSVKDLECTEFSALPGKGLKGKVGEKDVFAGSEKFISSVAEIPENVKKEGENLSEQGKTPLFFVKDGKILGIIAVADKIKEDSAQAVKELHNLGIKVVMITGDNERVAHSVARHAGIDEVFAGVLPDGKARVIQNLKKTGKVCYVGDGINDAPALTSADVGIAIGAGVDVAIESADVVLTKSKLVDGVGAIRLGRETLKKIKQNLFWAFFYNVLGIPLAAGVFIPLFGLVLNPMIGAAAMSLSSVCVVTNALRLNLVDPLDGKKDKPRKKKTKKKEQKKMEKTLLIKGMMCMHCEARIKKLLESVDGIESVDVSLADKTAKVRLTKAVDDEYLKQIIKNDGYEEVEIL